MQRSRVHGVLLRHLCYRFDLLGLRLRFYPGQFDQLHFQLSSCGCQQLPHLLRNHLHCLHDQLHPELRVVRLALRLHYELRGLHFFYFVRLLCQWIRPFVGLQNLQHELRGEWVLGVS